MKNYLTALISAAFAGSTLASPELTRISSYEFGISNKDGGVAEISAFDASSKKLFTASAEIGGVVVLDYSNPALPVSLDTLRFVAEKAGEKRLPNSVAVNNGVLAVAVERVDSITNSNSVLVPRHLTGDITLFDLTKTGTPFIASYEVGYLPDMVTFSSDGKKVAVANEGEPSAEYLADPVGSISVIDLSAGTDKGVVTNLEFTQFNADSATLVASGVVLEGFKGATVAQDLEPEYVAINPEGTKAWVTLQEANSLALVDLTVPSITSVVPLYRKDLSVKGMGMDLISDKKFELANYTIEALPMPDGITHFTTSGKGYLLIANEGDGREYGTPYNNEIKVSKVTTWDPLMDQGLITKVPDLTIHVGESSNSSGQYDKLVMFGARSFSVLDESGKLIWDSGEEFEQITSTLAGAVFNASHAPGVLPKFDDRSPKKGPEPEAVTVGTINGVPYAFIALERIGGVMVYDLSNPELPTFVQYVNSRDFTITTEGNKNALGPEGLLFVSADKSPTGKALVIVSNEVSGTIETFSFDDSTGVTTANSNGTKSLNFQVDKSAVSLSIPANQELTIRLFTLNGREISTLHRGMITAGSHTIALPKSLGAGAYLISVETATEQQARMISF